MRLTMPSGTPEGIPLTVMPFREDAVIGTMSLATLVRLVPSPRQEEDPRLLKNASGHDRKHAELRSTVQRTLKSQKGKNIPEYAEYIAGGILGKHGSAWSTPPITLWHAGDVAAMSEELVPESGLRTLTVAPDAMVIAIDGETQTTAWHDIYRDPEAFGLTYAELSRRVRIPFELYLGISPADARQIFYDRNVKGIDVAKNLAMSMDQRDLATRLAYTIGEKIEVETSGSRVPFGTLVNAGKRQLTRADKEVVTLSALRALIVTTIFGAKGVQYSAANVHEGDLPPNTDADEVGPVVTRLVSRLITSHFLEFARRSAITAPAVMAGLGVLLHRATPWCAPADAVGYETVERLLADVRWEREPAYWEGVCATVGATGRLNFSGGVKDSGGRVAGALLNPHTDLGRKIRGRLT
ncbi:DNA sulfur modification protein DndB [Streptomyces chilikensis]|uniref:DNA sulfur modification protein DndB n=1 Tax=Streptomyces chilikensis TaxID=1194079 RepID=UPI000B0AFD6F|nr:DNA sulfur modification protein DndB [Streptomyces chilikensis]